MKILYLLTFTSICLSNYMSFGQTIDNEPCIENSWEWALSVPASNDDNFNSDIQADLSGNLYTVGLINDQITLGDSTYQNTGGSDGYIAKYSETVILLWSTHVLVSGSGSHFKVTTDGYDNLYVAGTFSDTLTVAGNSVFSNDGSSDIFLIKFNSSNDVQWVKNYGGVDPDELGDMDADQLGNVILTGKFSGSTNIEGISLNSTNGHDFIFQVNSAGNISWVEQFGDSFNWGTTVSIKSNSNIIVSGIYNTVFEIQGSSLQSPATPSLPEADAAFLAEFDSNGNLVWLKQANLGSNSKVLLELDRSDAIYIGGNFFEEVFMVGDSTHTGPAGYIAKYDPLGNAQWSRQIGDFYFNWVSGIAFDAANNLFVNGLLTSAVTFGGQSYHENGGFMAKYSPDGEELKLWSTGEFTYDRVDLLTSDLQGNVYCTGIFSGAIQFDQHLVTAEEGINDIYIAKLENGTPVLAAEPQVATSKISFSNVGNGSVDLSWTNGDGISRIILARKMGKAGTGQIVDGATYSDGAGVFGSGTQTGNKQFVVYNGNGNFATVTGLEPNKVYSFTAVEYSEDQMCAASANYKTTQNKVTYMTTPSSGAVSKNLVVSPNPVGQTMNVTLTTTTRGNNKLVLMDKLGVPLQNFDIYITEDITETYVDLSNYNLSPGIYYLRFKDDKETSVFKMIKR